MAGGHSRRFQKEGHIIDKALIKHENWGNIPLMIKEIEVLKKISNKISIIVNDNERKLKYLNVLDENNIKQIEILIDDQDLSARGPLNSLLTAFKKTREKYCFFIPCDMPYINPKLIEQLYTKRNIGDIISFIFPDGKIEPLFSLYDKKKMLKISKYVDFFKKDRPSALFRGTNALYFMSIKEILELDPDLKTFININGPQLLNTTSLTIPDDIDRDKSFKLINKTFKKEKFDNIIEEFFNKMTIFNNNEFPHLFKTTNFSCYWIASYFYYLASNNSKENSKKRKKFLEISKEMYSLEKDFYEEHGLKFLSRHSNLDVKRILNII
ncbi:MAG: molybdenum cofactor guanylyltransferase [Candidatus Helarchaeota archaeon]